MTTDVSLEQQLHQLLAQDAVLEAAFCLSRQWAAPAYREQDLASLYQCAMPLVASLPMGDEEARWQGVLSGFYRQLGFSFPKGDVFEARYGLIQEVLAWRSGNSLMMGLLFIYVARLANLTVRGINFPGNFLVQFCARGKPPRYLDPMNGRVLHGAELEALYAEMTGEDDEEAFCQQALQPASSKALVVRMLQNLKQAFMHQQQSEPALQCMDLLVSLCPDDPYARRDRGNLLQRLNFPEIALQDYRYYIQHCPRDPAAQLLKLQIRHLDTKVPVLH